MIDYTILFKSGAEFQVTASCLEDAITQLGLTASEARRLIKRVAVDKRKAAA